MFVVVLVVAVVTTAACAVVRGPRKVVHKRYRLVGCRGNYRSPRQTFNTATFARLPSPHVISPTTTASYITTLDPALPAYLHICPAARFSSSSGVVFVLPSVSSASILRFVPKQLGRIVNNPLAFTTSENSCEPRDTI